MSRHTLHLSLPRAALAKLPTTDFLWRPVGEPSSLKTNVSPRAEELGAVSDPAVEFLRLAVLTYLVDRTTERPRRGWQRELELVVPVVDPERWAPVVDRVNATLGFLTGDAWDVSFIARRAAARRKVNTTIEPCDRVSLFSGGADSLGGLLVSVKDGVLPHLVSHSNWTIVAGSQNHVLDALRRLDVPEATRDLVDIGRQKRQIGSGLEFPHEPTSRSRSLIFVASGVAAASVRGAELWIPENGFASLNLPLAKERRGALSTRTTHPLLLDDLGGIIKDVGMDVRITNPFELMTKGEVFSGVASEYGTSEAASVLSASHSCARSGANYHGFKPSTQCGVCFGCLVRRAAFAASGLTDTTTYIEKSLRSDPDRRDKWLNRADVVAIEYRAKRPYVMADVLAASLPERVDPEAALDLANRGAAELALVKIP
ncbi:MAG TPA: hypothetical protein VGO31_06305 [Microbacteriaceae bacterium]|nr:hypothetical protein [Microbacteriaceae bacterium]